MRTVDLFAGGGGLTGGAHSAGFNPIASVDNWGPALEILQSNFSHEIIDLDLGNLQSSINMIRSLSPDIILGGPPCQDFSQAGSGIEGQRAELTVQFAKIVTNSSSEYFIMENVPSVLGSRALKMAKSIFTDSKFSVTSIGVDAAYYGVPQHRRRVFLIGSRSTPVKGLREYIRNRETTFPKTVRQFWPEIGFEHYYRHPRNYNRRGVFCIDEPSPTIRGMNRPKPPNYVVHPGDTSQDPNVRSLTSYERSRIQTFPKNFQWGNLNQSKLDQLVGNAVPALLAENVLSGFGDWLNGSVPTVPTFTDWLTENGCSVACAKSTTARLRKIYRSVPHEAQRTMFEATYSEHLSVLDSEANKLTEYSKYLDATVDLKEQTNG